MQLPPAPPSGWGNGHQTGQWRANLIACQKELEESQLQLEQERAALEQELGRRAGRGRARAHAGEVNCKIVEDRQGSPVFARASQNVATAAALLKALPAAMTPEEQRAREKMCKHLHLAADQQAENSMLRRHNLLERRPDPATPGARNIPVRSASRNDGHRPGHRGQDKARGSPPRQGNPRNNEPRRGDSRAQSRDHDGRRGNVPVKQRLGHDRDARHTIKARRREYDYDDEAGSVAKNYRPCRGGRYDSGEDQSMSPEPPGPRCSPSASAARTCRPSTDPPPTSRSTESDAFIIRNLPLYLADSARTWLEHLPSDRIACWEDLKEIFVGNF